MGSPRANSPPVKGKCRETARGEARSAKQTKSIAFRGPNGLPWMARPGLVEARSAAPRMACTACQNASCPVCEADEKHRFSRAERLAMDGKTGVGRSQKRRAKDGMHSLPECKLPGLRSRRKASLFEGRTACHGWQDRGWSKPEAPRQGWHAQPARMQVARSAKQTKSNAFRGARASVCEAQLRAQTERHRAVLGGRTNGLPWMARPGLVEARSAAPRMACTVCRNAGCPVCEADEKQRFSRGEGKRLRSAASRAGRAPPGCARWPAERLDRMSRLGPVKAGSVAPWMA